MRSLPKRFATADYLGSPRSPFAHLCPALTGLEIRGLFWLDDLWRCGGYSADPLG